MDYYVIAFSSTHYAITAQTLLEGKVDFQVMPTPRAISSGCGISIRLQGAASEDAVRILEENQMSKDFYAVYHFLPDSPPQKL